MKHLYRLITLIVTLFSTFCLQAQSREEDKVAKTVESLRMAMISADSNQLAALTSEKLSYGHSSGLIENKKEFIDKLTSGKSDFITMDLSDQTIIVSDQVALVRHTLRASIMDGGQSGQLALKVLLVFEKSGRKWLLIARQAVRIL